VAQNLQLRLAGLNLLMKSDAVQRRVDAEGRRIAAAAGENFEYVASPHKWMARGFVQPKNARGRRQEAIEKRLTRAVGTPS
jgi:hypothetical protein